MCLVIKPIHAKEIRGAYKIYLAKNRQTQVKCNVVVSVR